MGRFKALISGDVAAMIVISAPNLCRSGGWSSDPVRIGENGSFNVGLPLSLVMSMISKSMLKSSNGKLPVSNNDPLCFLSEFILSMVRKQFP
jgi:hypothetical protein